ncbi:hypothetical protein C353_06496 [Cryptococcus neoformans AD1-83a]|nr:hypothetical protein C353_06496 [Cryptococcus neoformans var. grubii AD1-83a]
MAREFVYGWLIFNVHPRLHPTRLHPTPHAPFEFAFLTSDSTLDTRLSLNARHICSATPQHPTHHTQLVHSHSATPPRWLNYATDEREDMQDRWQSTRWEGGTGGRIHGGRGWDMAGEHWLKGE